MKSCIIGTGININQMQFLSDAPNPISLAQIMRREIPLKHILNAVLDAFSLYLDRVNNGDFESLHKEYMAVLYRRIGSYGYSDASGEFYARIEEVRPDGRLLLRRDDGTLSEYEFKEVKFIR